MTPVLPTPAPDAGDPPHRFRSALVLGLLALGPVALGACTPTVKVEAPSEPIRIDLNVRIQQDVLIRLDKSVEDLHDANPDIF
ncbi:MAG: YnbE family lipoprotein [Rhodospirillaceae bacterium]